MPLLLARHSGSDRISPTSLVRSRGRQHKQARKSQLAPHQCRLIVDEAVSQSQPSATGRACFPSRACPADNTFSRAKGDALHNVPRTHAFGFARQSSPESRARLRIFARNTATDDQYHSATGRSPEPHPDSVSAAECRSNCVAFTVIHSTSTCWHFRGDAQPSGSRSCRRDFPDEVFGMLLPPSQVLPRA